MGKLRIVLIVGVLAVLSYGLWPRGQTESPAQTAESTDEKVADLEDELRELRSDVDRLERKIRNCDCN